MDEDASERSPNEVRSSANEQDTKRARTRQKGRWDWAQLAIAAWALVSAAVCFGSYVLEDPTTRNIVVLLAATPIVIPAFVSLSIVGARAEFNPVISRKSLLWSWLSGVNRWWSAGALLAVGALIGAFAGQGLSSTDANEQWAVLRLLGWLVISWGIVSSLVWGGVAAVGVARLGVRGRTRVVDQVGTKVTRPSKGFRRFVAEFSSPMSALLAGFTLAYLIFFLGTILIPSA